MQKVKNLWARVPEHVKRVLHAFWQAAGGVLLQGLLAAHSSSDVKAAVFLSGTVGLAAVKALVLTML